MRYQLLPIVTVICISLMGITFTLVAFDAPDKQQQRDIVKGICNWSISSSDEKDRAMCSYVQNATNTEYLCNKQVVCWVESK